MNAESAVVENAAVVAPPQPAPEALQVIWAPIGHILKSEDNPRKLYPKSEMDKLIASMRQSGFRPWQPLIARPLPEDAWRMPGLDGEKLYQLAAGHRRRKAAIGAGLEYVPVLVREMSEEEFLDVLNFDNSGREDVHPLHEAAGWSGWMKKTGKGVADIAARIGQSIGYVYQRLKYDDLIDEARQAFLDNKFSPGHAILIARESDQKKALKLCQPPAYDPNGKIPSVREFAELLRRDLHVDLSRAAFDQSDEMLLPQAGSCNDCPKHTRNSAGPEEAGDGNECMDAACFARKLGAHLVQIETKLKKDGAEYVKVSGHMNSKREGVLGASQYTLVEKKASGAIPAIVIDGAEAGRIVHVRLLKPEPAAPAAPATSPTRATAPSHAADPEPEEDQHGTLAENEEKRRTSIARETAVRMALLKAVRDGITRESLRMDDLRGVLALALLSDEYNCASVLCEVHGVTVPPKSWNQEREAAESLRKRLEFFSETELTRLAVELSVDIGADLDVYAIERNEKPLALQGLCKRFGVDAPKIRRRVEDEHKEAEGGKRKEVEKPAAKAAPKPEPAKPEKPKAPAAPKPPKPARAKPLPSAQHAAKKKAAAKKPAKPAVKKSSKKK